MFIMHLIWYSSKLNVCRTIEANDFLLLFFFSRWIFTQLSFGFASSNGLVMNRLLIWIFRFCAQPFDEHNFVVVNFTMKYFNLLFLFRIRHFSRSDRYERMDAPHLRILIQKSSSFSSTFAYGIVSKTKCTWWTTNTSAGMLIRSIYLFIKWKKINMSPNIGNECTQWVQQTCGVCFFCFFLHSLLHFLQFHDTKTFPFLEE